MLAFSLPWVDATQQRNLDFRAGTTCCSPVRWRQQLNSAGPTHGFFLPQSPNLFWPHDHAWRVASEINLFCTQVAGSDELAEALVTNPHLEAWRVHPADPVAFDSDQINTWAATYSRSGPGR
jgi:hypothetical protein